MIDIYYHSEADGWLVMHNTKTNTCWAFHPYNHDSESIQTAHEIILNGEGWPKDNDVGGYLCTFDEYRELHPEEFI